LALSHGQIGKAIQFNPFAVVLAAAVASWSAMAGILGRLPTPAISKPCQNLAWTVLGFALLGNWIYVISAGG
tara:strand:+ start:11408 stop:11623 length:216 start_codon:yes stop_codon:yes gene_type:complete